nr:MAG TPA: tail-collar fiber protein [Caudoviricetes sp.]
MGNVVTQWNRFSITNKGLEMHQQAIATGATITFNYAKIGQGAPDNTANIPSMTDIISVVEQVPVVRSVADGVTHCVGIRIDNATFKQPVLMTEIGLFASIGEDTPTLYGYTYATQGYDSIPAGSTSHYVWTVSIDTIISRAQSISFSYDGSKVYATEDEIDDLIQSCEANKNTLNSKADKSYVDSQLGNKADADHTHDAATSAAPGFLSAADKTKLDGISDSADSVSIVPALTAGTKIGTITVNGVAVDLYCQTNTDTKYSPGAGITISGTTISNSGVRSVASGSTNGTISVNTGGTAANVAVKGLASAAYQAVQTAAGTVGLHRISSGTAAATTTNCPAGCWYGKHD